MKAKCRKDLFVGGKVVCRKDEMVDVEPFDATWFEEDCPWIRPIDYEPFLSPSPMNRVAAMGYSIKRSWCNIQLYVGTKAARYYNGLDFNEYFESVEMPLTAENVERIHNLCVGEPNKKDTFFVDGVKNIYWYNKGKIARYTKEVEDMLMQLPKTFRKSEGGGWSFLNMCMREDDVQWTGLHSTVEKLLCLGIACGKVKFLLPKNMWSILPGGMPYIVILSE